MVKNQLISVSCAQNQYWSLYSLFLAILGRFNTLNIQSGNPAWCPAALQALGGPKSREKIGPILPKKKKKKKKRTVFFRTTLSETKNSAALRAPPRDRVSDSHVQKFSVRENQCHDHRRWTGGFFGWRILSILLTQNNIFPCRYKKHNFTLVSFLDYFQINL